MSITTEIRSLLENIIAHEEQREHGESDEGYRISDFEEVVDGITVQGEADYSKGHREIDYVLGFNFSPPPRFDERYTWARLIELAEVLKKYDLLAHIEPGDNHNGYACFSRINSKKGVITTRRGGFDIRIPLTEVHKLAEKRHEVNTLTEGISFLVDFYLNNGYQNRKT